jgi:hypothetical protein
VSKQSVLEDFCWNVNFGHKGTNSESSNWPALQLAVYWSSVASYLLGFAIAAFAVPGPPSARGRVALPTVNLVFVWRLCTAPLYGAFVRRLCTAPLYGAFVWRFCMAAHGA